MENNEPFSENLQSGLTYKNEANLSGVSWAAVIAGAFVTAALSVILLALGTGLGLSSVSPWSNVGASASAVGRGAIVWLIAMQIIASAMGGYLAGRLRTKWATIHTHEVYFRDTAHGFLVWAVALVITASFLAAAAASTQSEGRSFDPEAYFVDTLFRSDHPVPDRNDTSVRAEVGGILANALRQKEIPAADKTYLAQLVTAKTGLQQADAENRVSSVFAQDRKAADAARKAAAHFLLWLFIALLIGAFCASYAATVGGRQRDNVRTV
jgi:MFS family permease